MKDYNSWKNLTEFPSLNRKLRIAAVFPNSGGCAYYRIILPSRKLLEHFSNIVEIKTTENILGWKQNPASETIDYDLIDWADIIWCQNLPNFGAQNLARTCGIVKERGKLFYLDTDDLLTELYKGHRLEQTYKDGGLSEIVKFVYSHSDIVTVTQSKFAERIAQFCGPNTLLAVVKNAIDYNLPCWNVNKNQYPKVKCVKVGWAGGIHHEEDVKEFASVPWLVNQKVGKENVRWDFYGKPPPTGTKEDEWQADVWRNYERIICSGFKSYKNYTINAALPADAYGSMYANMDLAIAPLQMNEFNDSKSDIKVAECSRYKVPLICSNVGCYNETIVNGKTGYLISTDKNSKQEWVRILTKCIKDKDLVKQMGENLYKIGQEYFDINKVIHNRLNLFEEKFRLLNAS